MDEIYLDLIGALERGVDLAEVQAALDTLRQDEPSSERVVGLEAVLLERQGKLEEARGVLETFVCANLGSGVARCNLARLQYKMGERGKALATLRLGLLKQPNQERALHLYAALLEEDGGPSGALGSLSLLAQTPGAWLPAWVAAQLAISRAPDQIGKLLLLAAQRAEVPFPPNPTGLMAMLQAAPLEFRREIAARLRPYCIPKAQLLLDAFLEQTRTPVPGVVGSERVVHLLHRSVWRHQSQPRQRQALALSPVVLIKPESWGVEEVAGRLSRGFALLVAESLDSLAGCPVAVIFETLPQAGVVARDRPCSGAELAAMAGSSCKHLLSSYLSFRPPNEFLLDAEIYNSKGDFLTRESCRAAHPGACLQQLAQRLSASLSSPDGPPYPPAPDLELDDALARETVASLILCAEEALGKATLGNPGRLLDALVEYALKAQSAAGMLTLWAGIEAAARAGLPGGQGQRELLAGVMAENPGLSYWVTPRQ